MSPAIYSNLNPDKALIWRIVHRDNLPWILDRGLVCANSALRDPRHVAIGIADLISQRSQRVVPMPPGGTLADYVPFYFTPFSPMLLNILTGRNVAQRAKDEICILVSSLPRVAELGIRFLFTDRHAYLQKARYYDDPADLRQLDWERLQTRNFKRDPEDPERFERYEAEALVHRGLPVAGLRGVICHDDSIRASISAEIAKRGLPLHVHVRPDWYF